MWQRSSYDSFYGGGPKGRSKGKSEPRPWTSTMFLLSSMLHFCNMFFVLLCYCRHGAKASAGPKVHPLYQRGRPKPSQGRPSVPRPDGCSGPAPIRPDPSRPPRPDPGLRPKAESGHPTLRPRSVHPRLRRLRPRPEPTHPRVRPRPKPHPRVRPRRRAQARSQRPVSGLLSGSFRPRPRHRRRGAQRRARGCQSRERYWVGWLSFFRTKETSGTARTRSSPRSWGSRRGAGASARDGCCVLLLVEFLGLGHVCHGATLDLRSRSRSRGRR